MPDVDQLTFYTQARVLTRATDDALLTAAKKYAPDPAIFDQYPPFMWLNEISSDRLDAYFTVMDPATTLPNYAADAAAGVAVLIGHDSRSLPIGYSLTGTLEHTGDVVRVLSDAYALTDETSAGVINKVRAGIVRDDSVGFSAKGAKCLCSICGLDMWRDWDCWHMPGFEYEVAAEGSAGSNGKKVTMLATGLIVNAHLSEYSLVYDGATPGAAVLQAQRNAEAGRLSISQARLIEQRYRMVLPGKRVSAPGYTQGVTMDEKDVQAILERAGVPTDKVGIARLQWLADEHARLTPLAADGAQYRTDLVAGGVAEAVRAFGAEAGAKKQSMLERASLTDIKELTESWRAIGDEKLKGGRLTVDDSGAENPQPMTYKKVMVGGLSKS